MKKQILLASAMLGMVVAAIPAQACISEPIITREHVVARPGAPVKLVMLDLLSVVVPRKSTDGWRVEFSPAEPPLLRSLTPEQLEMARENQRFVMLDKFTPQAILSASRGPQWHFGAIHTGKTTMRLVNDTLRPPASYTFEVEVVPRKIEQVSRGTVRKISRDQVGSTIAMQYYDTLEITLSGNAEQQWNTASAKAAGLELKEKRAAADGTTTLVFKPVSAGADNAALVLTDAAGNSYAFRIQHQATAKC